MKKLLLCITLIALAFMSSAQIIVRGVSPQTIATNYLFEWADPTGGSGWATPDWNLPGNNVQGKLMMVEDGTPGTNAEGHPISQEGCNNLTNQFAGIVKTVSIIQGGTGYTNGNNILTSGGSGTGAKVQITAEPIGNVLSLNASSLIGGAGYTSSNSVATTGGGGNGLTVDVVSETIGSVSGLNNASLVSGSNYATSNGVATTLISGAGSGATVNIIASPSGVLSAGSSSNAGTGYTSGNGVSVTGGTGTGATLNITASPIIISSGTLTNVGIGYTSGNGVSVTGGTGTGATLDITATSGNITLATIANAGAGYSVGDVLTIVGGNGGTYTVNTVSGGLITGVILNSGGSGYSVNDVLTISGGNGGTYTVNTVSGGTVTSVAINNAGLGYSVGDVLQITGGGSNASITISSVTNGGILSVAINNPGTGYTNGATVTISGGTGGTINISNITNGGVLTASIVDAGYNYNIGDTIIVAGGNGNAKLKVTALTPIIAVVYRNTCNFSTKALKAQNKGAVGVIIINRDPEAIGMAAGTDGASVTIPVVMISSTDGATLVAEMANGPVEVFMGNKQNKFANDGGSTKEQALISRYGSVPLTMANNNYSFPLGIQAYNFGSSNNNFTVSADIKNPSGTSVYNNVIPSVPVVSGDTLPIFTGATYSFPDFTMTNAVVGEYTLTYTISIDGIADEDNFDNVFTSTFNVSDDVLSLARQDAATGKVLVKSFPSNTLSSYQACMRLQDVYPTINTAVEGLYFAVSSSNDIIENEAVTAEIFEWNDPWTEIGDAWSNITFNSLNQVGVIDYVCASNADNAKVIYAAFPTPVLLNDDQRYLVCLTTFNPEVSFGYDNGIVYDANLSIFSQPISPIQVEDDNGLTWFSGWSGSSAFSLGLKLINNAGVADLNSVDGVAYPNPASDKITVSVDAEGFAKLTVSDISGRIAFSNALNLVNGKAEVNISTLESGIYVFNVVLENGKTSQFNVVKK